MSYNLKKGLILHNYILLVTRRHPPGSCRTCSPVQTRLSLHSCPLLIETRCTITVDGRVAGFLCQDLVINHADKSQPGFNLPNSSNSGIHCLGKLRWPVQEYQCSIQSNILEFSLILLFFTMATESLQTQFSCPGHTHCSRRFHLR